MSTFKIFIVEDDIWYADLLYKYMSLNPDFEVEKFSNGKDCLNNLFKRPSLITTDSSLPDMDGRELMKKVHDQYPDISTIIISDKDDISIAVELLKEGAFDYIVKNENTTKRLWNSIRLFRDNLALRIENEQLKKEVGKKYDFSNIMIGESEAIKSIYHLVEKAVDSSITVSITGETGTGKELIAKAIHYKSKRKNYPFMAINIGAIPKELVESELFGYEKGAFTGAYARKSGIFEDANNGTLFLDEIAEMELNIQSKFLRVLQDREVRRIGSSQSTKVDVRIMTATHKNLSEEVKNGNFRADLYYRVMGLPIHLPPLRERGNDVVLLTKYFANEFCKENDRKPVSFIPDAIKKLLGYSFPGNIRELKAIVELAIILSDDDNITPDHINFNPAESITTFPDGTLTLEEHILRIIKESLIKNEGSPTLVAKALGISRATVYRYIKKLES